MSRNMLAEETSPYLLQHKDNPVHWRPWNRETLKLAQAQDKPILLSVGYSACHWCHVMAHESFENPDIAALMNESFINIKVDREERPDLDAVYQAALGMLGEHGGWPLTMFLTPTGEPFWGGTYFPPTSRYGRPGFPDVLRSLAETYQNNQDAVTKNAGALREGLAKLSESKQGEGISAARVDQVASAALRIVDPYLGGTHGAPKFPQPVFFKFLWQAYTQNQSRMFQEAVIITLDNLCQGGIYDHLGGGFARYATDNAWLVPHFEKMLYDNALMIELLTDAWRGTKRDLYAVRVRESIDWLLRDMQVFAKDGDNRSFAFASAFDADSEGEEGRYYVWTQNEVDALLGDDAAAFSEAYQVTPMGNWEHKTILNRSHQLSLSDAATESKLAKCRATLLAVRDGRVPPLRDDKVLADWNGLTIAALATAGTVFAEPAWIDAARTAFAFVIDNMSENDNLRHSWRQGRARDESILDDYANMSRAALALYNATGDAMYLEKARAWIAVTDEQFRDAAAGGYFLSGKNADDVIARSKNAIDNAVPSGNGTMVDVLARLYYLTGDSLYWERAEETIKAFAGETTEYMVNTPMLLMGAGFLAAGTQVVIVGIDSDPAALALARAAFEAPAPASIILRLNPSDQVPDAHPAAGKGMVDGQPTAYVCKGPVCGPPTTEPQVLQELLSGQS